VSKKLGTKRGSMRIDEIGIEIERVINLTLGIKSVSGVGRASKEEEREITKMKNGERIA
jgi:hypothetical protein